MNVLGFVIGVIIILAALWGATALISHIFNIEDEGNQRLVRWGLIALFLIGGALVRRLIPSGK